jgi:hypothetical protein
MDDKKFNSLTKPQQDLVIKIAAEAERQGVKPELALAIAEAETGGAFSHYRGDQVLTSPAGAKGVMQIMPDTARLYNKNLGTDIDPDNEESNIKGGVFILKDLLTKYKSPRNAVALYNASPKATEVFRKTYSTDPDAAILSLPEETRNYSLRISKNFNLDDDQETGLMPPINKDGVDESETEGEKLKREGSSIDPNATAGEPAKDETLLEKAERIYQENKDNLAIPAAAFGAAKGLAEKVLTNPSANMFAAGETTPDEVRALQQRARTAQIRTQEIGDEIARRQSSGASVADLEDELRLRQSVAAQADQELRMATEEARALNRAPAPAIPETGAPVGATESRAGRASGPKVEGDSGTRNWMIQEAGQKHQLPEAILDLATDKTKDSPTGGKRLIEEDLKNLKKIEQLGMGDTKLTTTPSGAQLQLPSGVSSGFEAELASKQEAERVAQRAAADQAEAQRLAQEQQLAQQRQAAQQRAEQARQQKINASQQAAEAQRQANAERTQAAAEARRASTAQTTSRAASKVAQEAAEAQPSALKMMAREAGRRFSEKLPVIGNTLSAAGATLSVNEAIERYKEGDYSGSVLGTIEAALNVASMAPPTSPAGLAIKGVGAVGSIGMIPVWIAHDYFGNKGPWAQKKENPPQKAMGGLTLMR